MIKCSVQLGDQIFVKGYGFLSFAKNMIGSIGKNISRNLAGNIVKKLIDHAKQSATNALKTASKKAIQKVAAAAGDLIGNKAADWITEISKTLPHNNSETNKEEIFREIYISPERKKKKYWWSKDWYNNNI